MQPTNISGRLWLNGYKQKSSSSLFNLRDSDLHYSDRIFAFVMKAAVSTWTFDFLHRNEEIWKWNETENQPPGAPTKRRCLRTPLWGQLRRVFYERNGNSFSVSLSNSDILPIYIWGKLIYDFGHYYRVSFVSSPRSDPSWSELLFFSSVRALGEALWCFAGR